MNQSQLQPSLPLRTSYLRRGPSTPDGTFGTYTSDTNLSFHTCEKPWENNLPNVSCIEPGRYLALWQWSSFHQCNLYHLQNVHGRTEVEIHSANTHEQIKGCVALGDSIAPFGASSIRPGVPSRTMNGVTNSVASLARFEADLRDSNGNQESFWLVITNE